MSFSRVVAWVCLCCVSLLMAASCTSDTETEPYVPSEPGAVQPSSGGPLLAEADACTQLQSAESSARSALGCAAVARECPNYIRPAGGSGCFRYSKASLTGCAALYGTFTACTDFDAHPCLVSATACEVEAGEGGAGGALGAAGAAGSSAAPDDGGSGGSAEIAGAAGASAAGAGGA